MTYAEFLKDIDKYVGYVVEFKTRFKSNGKIFTSQRYVWDNKEFGALKPDSLIEVLSVKVLYKKETKRTDVAHVREYSIPVEGKYYYNVQVCQALNSGNDVTYVTCGKLCKTKEEVRDFLKSAMKYYTDIIHVNA